MEVFVGHVAFNDFQLITIEGTMPTPNAPIHRSGFIGLALLPRETRDLIHKACLIKAQPIMVLDSRGSSNIFTSGREI